jgi:Ca-activated chloride channel family protein
MDILRLDNTEWMHLFWFLAIMVVLFVMALRWKKRALQSYGDFPVFRKTAGSLSFARPRVKFFLFFVAMLFLVVAIVNPQIGSKLREAERKGVDLMIAVDVSRSMDATDIRPSRLERSRQAIARLIDELTGDRIGIIVFAGKAYTQLPITTDYAAAKMYLSTLSSDMVPAQGTSIGSAISLAMESFSDNNHSKSIIVITDGENHDEDAVEQARIAAEKGITVHTIGMGLPEGAPIPVMQNGRRTGFKKDKDGNTVMTRLNEKLLTEVASEGKGTYVRANNAQAGLKTIFDEINRMEKQKFESKVYADYEDRFQYFLAVAIVLLMIEVLLVNRKSRFAGKINLFSKEEST